MSACKSGSAATGKGEDGPSLHQRELASSAVRAYFDRDAALRPDSGDHVRGPLSNSLSLRQGRGYVTCWPCGKHRRVSSVNSAISRIAGAKLEPPPCDRALCPHGRQRPCSILLRRRGHQAAEQVFFVLTQQHVYRHPNELALVDVAALEALLPQFRP